MQVKAINVTIGILGLAIGAIGNSIFFTPDTVHLTDSTAISDSALKVKTAPIGDPASVESIEPKRIEVSSINKKENNDNDEKESVALDTSHANAHPESLLRALDGVSIDMIDTPAFELTAQQVSKWLQNSPNAAIDIFNLFNSDIDDEMKGVLEYILVTGEHEGLTENILNEMMLAGQADIAGWETIMSLTSISSTDEREAMLTVLPSITDESLVSATLNAVQPQLLPTEERIQFINDLSPYANNDNEEIKSAAIIALGNFSAHDYSYVIEDALATGSEEVKRSAIYAASVGGMRTDIIKNQMNSIMQDESASLELRADAFNGLNSFNLDENEYNSYYEFYREYILPLEQAANRG